MSSFVHCRGCGQQIHESAPTCPKCGAPQNLGVAASDAVATTPPTTYAQVPWFRRRWFIVLMVLSITPVAAILAATGTLYFDKKGQLAVLPKDAKVLIYICTGSWLWNLMVDMRGSTALIFILSWVLCGCVLGLKNSWKQPA
jgi:hypothetical protein